MFKFSTHKTQLVTTISLDLQLVKRNSQLTKSNLQLVILFPIRKTNLQLVKMNSELLNLFSYNRNSQLVTHNLQLVRYKTTAQVSFKYFVHWTLVMSYDFLEKQLF